ncbi:DUF2931 family protein [Kordia antarctica]|nr:DUF2931 family protein [Kordia antarctica]
MDVYKTNKNKLITLFFSFLLLLISCNQSNTKDRFQWEAAMSAPKYYPVGGAKVNFGNAGNSSLTNFDNGWGHPYGTVSSAERYKKLPKEVFVSYASAIENLVYEGTVPLPYDKIKQLFEKHIKNKKKESGIIMVGMAPGGWVHVWVYFHVEDLEIGINNKIEITKFQLKGKEDLTMNEGFRNKESDYWAKYKQYWDHFGIPLEAWVKNKKEYDIYFNFGKPNTEYNITDVLFSSLDGTIYYNITNDMMMKKRKLPSDLVVAWGNKNDSLYYQSHLLMPKNFSKIIKNKKSNTIEIQLEIEEDDQYGILYLIIDHQKEKIVRFKNLYTPNNKGLGESDFSEEVEYFLE